LKPEGESLSAKGTSGRQPLGNQNGEVEGVRGRQSQRGLQARDLFGIARR